MTASLHALAGQLLIAGFDGTTLPETVAQALRDSVIGGVILFSRNVGPPSAVADLNAAVYAAAAEGGQPLPFLSIDQEGGRVQRLRAPLTVVPPMARVGRAADARLANEVGRVLGSELEALGFNVDWAPCADLRTNPANTVIGDRAFGDDPNAVARAAGALALGLLESGIIPCAKHFPGHGDTLLDSHFDLPVVEHPIERLQDVELRVFQSLIRGAIPMIMTAHLVVPAIDPDWPITLSEAGIEHLLRRRMGFTGVVVSDDLEMKAVADRFPIEELVERGIRAGVDVFLVCHTEERWRRAHETLVRLAESDPAFRRRLEMSAARVAELKTTHLRPWTRPDDVDACLGTEAHARVIARIPADA